MRFQSTIGVAVMLALGCGAVPDVGAAVDGDDIASAQEAAVAAIPWDSEWGDEGVIIEGGADWVVTLNPRVTLRHIGVASDPIVAWCLRDDGDDTKCAWKKVRETTLLELTVTTKIQPGTTTTVTAFVRTKSGGVWSATDDAQVDAVPPAWSPSVPFVTLALDRRVKLSWEDGFSDDNGVASYRLFRTAPGSRVPSSCAATTGLLYAGSETAYDDGFNLLNLSFSTPPYIYLLCAVDEAGGASKFITAKVRPGGDSVPPVMTDFQVLKGEVANDMWVGAKTVGVTFNVTDDRTISGRIKVSLGTQFGTGKVAWSKWVAFDPYNLPKVKLSKDGHWTVLVRAMDEWTNVSEVQSEEFDVDTTGPAVPRGGLTVVVDGNAANVTWPDFVDAGSGLSGYLLFVGSGLKCSSEEFETLPSSSTTVTLDPGRTTLLVCAIDELGNVSTKGLSKAVTVR